MSTVEAAAPVDGWGGREDVGLIRRLLTYVLQHKVLFFFSLTLYPITALTVVAPPYIVQVILDEIIPSRDMSRLHLFCSLYFVAIAFEYASGFASQFAMSVLGQKAMLTLRQQLFSHVQKLPASYFDRHPLGRVLTRLTNDVEALAEVFATGAVTIIGDMVTITAIVAMMLWLDPGLTLFAFLVMPPLLVLMALFRRYARRAYRDIRRHLARINAFLAEHISGMSVVQVFGQEARTQAEFLSLNEDYRDANHASIRFDALLFAIVEAVGTCAVAALVWYGAPGLTSGAIGAGVLVAFIQYIRRFFIPIRDLSTKYTVLQAAFAASERVFTLLDEPVTIDSRAAAKPLSALKDRIEFKDVWFAYRGHGEEPEWVLKGINLTLHRGERVALVGATGSGKTSILKLLNRFYDVGQGSICVDGRDIRTLELPALRRLFAVVLQDVYLFSGTVMDNLSFDGRVDEQAVLRASRAVQLDGLVRAWPQGYATEVRERGSNFSAGERQLMAFARAMALDPDVLVLDEATSNVDSETEAAIQQALDVLLEGRTAVVVAHRLSTIRKVDRIVVLQRGRIVEEGDHPSLVRQGGVYAALAELQFGDNAL